MFAKLRNRKFWYLPFKFMHAVAFSKDDTKCSMNKGESERAREKRRKVKWN